MSLKLVRLEPGIVIGNRYKLEGVVGEGGMGIVYRAVHVRLGRPCAIKVLHPHLASDAEQLERFEQEARAAATIGHGNICEVIDVGMNEGGAPFLVMPLLEGCSLSELLQNQRLSVARAIDIMVQILSALEAAHNARILHRDLKPANVFVIDQMGDRKDFVKLLDFGISKFLDGRSSGELTTTGILMGTPAYMAPEQLRGDGQYDHRVDIYAAAVIFYMALTGRRPFDGDTDRELTHNILTSCPIPPASINPSISLELENVVMRAMAPDPLKRYESAGQMRDALLGLPESMAAADDEEDGRETADTIQTGTLPERKGGKVSPLVARLAILSVALCVGGGILMSLTRSNSQNVGQDPNQAPKQGLERTADKFSEYRDWDQPDMTLSDQSRRRPDAQCPPEGPETLSDDHSSKPARKKETAILRGPRGAVFFPE